MGFSLVLRSVVTPSRTVRLPYCYRRIPWAKPSPIPTPGPGTAPRYGIDTAPKQHSTDYSRPSSASSRLPSPPKSDSPIITAVSTPSPFFAALLFIIIHIVDLSFVLFLAVVLLHTYYSLSLSVYNPRSFYYPLSIPSLVSSTASTYVHTFIHSLT